jgi:hypothetical protein
MLGAAIAARPLAREGLGLLSSDLGRTRLAETPLPAWARAGARIVERKDGARAAPVSAAAAMRP